LVDLTPERFIPSMFGFSLLKFDEIIAFFIDLYNLNLIYKKRIR